MPLQCLSGDTPVSAFFRYSFQGTQIAAMRIPATPESSKSICWYFGIFGRPPAYGRSGAINPRYSRGRKDGRSVETLQIVCAGRGRATCSVAALGNERFHHSHPPAANRQEEVKGRTSCFAARRGKASRPRPLCLAIPPRLYGLTAVECV